MTSPLILFPSVQGEAYTGPLHPDGAHLSKMSHVQNATAIFTDFKGNNFAYLQSVYRSVHLMLKALECFTSASALEMLWVAFWLSMYDMKEHKISLAEYCIHGTLLHLKIVHLNIVNSDTCMHATHTHTHTHTHRHTQHT